VRNFGGSVGISLITTFVTRGTQAHQTLLVSHLVPHNHLYLDRLNQMETIVTPHSGAIAAYSQAYGLMYGTLQQQAAFWSYIDHFRLLAAVSLLLAPIIFLYRKSQSAAK
jgi:MFS transporter, DHA2 family, multidrug resistance protein